MRQLPILFAFVLVLATALGAQTGRHFHRPTRTPNTPPASATVEASSTAAAAPLRKLRSGRPWPKHHFGRLPANTTPQSEAQAVDASHGGGSRPRGFWRPRR